MKAILINAEDGDMMIVDGTLAVGDIRNQVIEHVLIACRGEYKHWPMVGGEITRMLGGRPDPMWKANVRSMLKSCMVDTSHITIENGIITVE